MDLIWLFIPGILFLGIFTSYTDFKFNKIKNKTIILSFIYGLIAYLLIFTFKFFNPSIFQISFTETITNILFAIVLGYGLWQMRIWPAGDGKLFIAFAFLMPPTVYQLGYQKWVPSITLFTNTIIISIIMLLVVTVFSLKRKNYFSIIKRIGFEIISPLRLLESLTYTFGGFWAIGYILYFLGLDTNTWLVLPLAILSFYVLKTKVKKYYIYIIVLAALRLLFDQSVYSLDAIRNFATLLLVWHMLINAIFAALASVNFFSKKIRTDQLKEGLQLFEVPQTIIEQNGNSTWYKDAPGFKKFQVLTEKDINRLKELDIKKVQIIQTVPFAPFMFIGVLITVLAKGNIFIYLKYLFQILGGIL